MPHWTGGGGGGRASPPSTPPHPGLQRPSHPQASPPRTGSLLGSNLARHPHRLVRLREHCVQGEGFLAGPGVPCACMWVPTPMCVHGRPGQPGDRPPHPSGCALVQRPQWCSCMRACMCGSGVTGDGPWRLRAATVSIALTASACATVFRNGRGDGVNLCELKNCRGINTGGHVHTWLGHPVEPPPPAIRIE